jgi:uncharacterized protein (DUF2267 family)
VQKMSIVYNERSGYDQNPSDIEEAIAECLNERDALNTKQAAERAFLRKKLNSLRGRLAYSKSKPTATVLPEQVKPGLTPTTTQETPQIKRTKEEMMAAAAARELARQEKITLTGNEQPTQPRQG